MKGPARGTDNTIDHAGAQIQCIQHSVHGCPRLEWMSPGCSRLLEALLWESICACAAVASADGTACAKKQRKKVGIHKLNMDYQEEADAECSRVQVRWDECLACWYFRAWF